MSDATATQPDAVVEAMMMSLIRQGAMHGSFEKLPVEECPLCQEKLSALRQRIRELVEEARSNAVADFLADKNFKIEAVEK